jgi:hypothetical protein
MHKLNISREMKAAPNDLAFSETGRTFYSNKHCGVSGRGLDRSSPSLVNYSNSKIDNSGFLLTKDSIMMENEYYS